MTSETHGLDIQQYEITFGGMSMNTESSILDLFEFIHGYFFTGIIKQEIFKLTGKTKVFDILSFKSNDNTVVPAAVEVFRTEKIATRENCSNNPVPIVNADTLQEFLELNYVPLGRSLEVNPCKTELDNWVSTGRLALFQTELTRIAIRELTYDEVKAVKTYLSNEFDKTEKAKNSFTRLKHLVTFGMNALDKLESNDHSLPEKYDFRAFLEGELSKRQRTTSTTTSSEETPFVNPFILNH